MRRVARYPAVRFAMTLAGCLPLGLARRIGRDMGSLAWWVSAKERRRALAHLGMALPGLGERQRRRIGRESFANLGKCLGEIAQSRHLDACLDSFFELDAAAFNLIRDAHAEGRGVILISAHLGNFELLARRVASAGVTQLWVVAKAPGCGRTTGMIADMRRAGGVHTIWRGSPSAGRDLLRVVRRGEILGLVIDQDTDVQGVFVDFMGHPAHTPRAAADLALRTGAVVITGFAMPRAGGGYRAAMERIEPPAGLSGEAAVVPFVQAMSDAIERAVRAAPEHWVWMHRRWRKTPGADGPAA